MLLILKPVLYLSTGPPAMMPSNVWTCSSVPVSIPCIGSLKVTCLFSCGCVKVVLKPVPCTVHSVSTILTNNGPCYTPKHHRVASRTNRCHHITQHQKPSGVQEMQDQSCVLLQARGCLAKAAKTEVTREVTRSGWMACKQWICLQWTP